MRAGNGDARALCHGPGHGERTSICGPGGDYGPTRVGGDAGEAYAFLAPDAARPWTFDVCVVSARDATKMAYMRRDQALRGVDGATARGILAHRTHEMCVAMSRRAAMAAILGPPSTTATARWDGATGRAEVGRGG